MQGIFPCYLFEGYFGLLGLFIIKCTVPPSSVCCAWKRLAYAPPLTTGTSGRCLRIEGHAAFSRGRFSCPPSLLPALPGVLPQACGTPHAHLGVASAASSASCGGLSIASSKETCRPALMACACLPCVQLSALPPRRGWRISNPAGRDPLYTYRGIGVTRSVKIYSKLF